MSAESYSIEFVRSVAHLLLLSLASTIAVPVGPSLEAVPEPTVPQELQDPHSRLMKYFSAGIFAGEKIPPKESSRTLIEMSFSIRSLDLDFKSGTFSVSGRMTLEWKDSRYMWDPADYGGMMSAQLPFSQDWAPDVILQNSVEEKFMYRQVGVLYYTGLIVYMMAVHSKSTCQPNFQDFPWGLQVCSLQFGSWINNQYNVEYRLPRNSTVGLTDFQPTVGWHIVNTKSRLVSARSPNPLFAEPTYFVVYDIGFKRDTYFDGAFRLLTKDNRTTEL